MTITSGQLSVMRNLRAKPIMWEGRIVIIGNVVVEERPWTRKKGLTRRQVSGTDIVLTEMDLWGWNLDLKCWARYDDEFVIERLLRIMDMGKMRARFENHILLPLQALGVDMTAYPEKNGGDSRPLK